MITASYSSESAVGDSELYEIVIVFQKGKNVMCKEYLCDSVSELNFKFENCLKNGECWIREDMSEIEDLNESH